MFDKVMKKINFGVIIFLIIMMPLDFLLLNYLGMIEIRFRLYFYEILHLIIPLEIFIYIYNIIKKNIKVNKYDIFIFILVILGIVVTINAVDPQTSFWGAYLRNEGLLAILSYYLLFLNSKVFNKDEVKKILDWLFIIGIVQFIYSILQVFVRGEYIFKNGSGFMASGFIGHPNMLGSFCLLLLGISLMMYCVYDNKKYLILSIIFYINLILSQATGPFFVFIVLFIFIVIVLSIKKIINWKKIFYLILIFVTTFIIINFSVEKSCELVFNQDISTANTIKYDIIQTLSIFSIGNDNELNKEEVIENYGSGRLTIWKNTMKIVPKYFWFGAGIDNFGYVYPDHEAHVYYDKAHNEYLQILITQGIFTLITYLLLLLSMFIDGLKSKEKMAWVLLVGFVGYAIQAFMNISVTTVAPFYFIICGMLVGVIAKEKV